MTIELGHKKNKIKIHTTFKVKYDFLMAFFFFKGFNFINLFQIDNLESSCALIKIQYKHLKFPIQCTKHFK